MSLNLQTNLTYEVFQAEIRKYDWLPAERISELMALAIQLDDAEREKLLTEIKEEETIMNMDVSTIVQKQEHIVSKEVRLNVENENRKEESLLLTHLDHLINSPNSPNG